MATRTRLVAARLDGLGEKYLIYICQFPEEGSQDPRKKTGKCLTFYGFLSGPKGILAGPAWLGCLATPTIQVKLIDFMRLMSNSLPRLITLIQGAACVKSKTHSK